MGFFWGVVCFYLPKLLVTHSCKNPLSQVSDRGLARSSLMQVYWEQFGGVGGLKDLYLFLIVLQIPSSLLWSGSVFSHRLCFPSFCDLILKTLHSEILAYMTSSWSHALLFDSGVTVSSERDVFIFIFLLFLPTVTSVR